MSLKEKGKKSSSMKDKFRKRAGEKAQGAFRVFSIPSGAEMLKVEKKMSLDVIPYTTTNNPEAEKGELWMERTYWVHKGLGGDDKPIICPKTFKKPCPICEEHQRLRRDDDADEDVVNSLKPSQRQLWNVIDRNARDKGVQILDASHYLFGRILEEEVNNGDDSAAAFADVEGGKTLNLRFKEEKKGGMNFMLLTRVDFVDRKPIKAEVLEAAHDLDAMLGKPLPAEELQKLMMGAGVASEEESDEDEEDDKPKGKKAKGKARDEDEEEEETDEDEEADESDDDDDASESDDDSDDSSDEDDGEESEESDEDDDSDGDSEESDEDEESDDDEESDEDDDSSDGDEESDDDDSDGDTDDDDEDEAPKGKSKSKAKSKAKSDDDDEDEDEDEGDTDEDDEEGDEESESDDDDEADEEESDEGDDDSDEDEDEDEPPVNKGKGKKAPPPPAPKKGKGSSNRGK